MHFSDLKVIKEDYDGPSHRYKLHRSPSNEFIVPSFRNSPESRSNTVIQSHND